jgi:hypothetical protein
MIDPTKRGLPSWREMSTPKGAPDAFYSGETERPAEYDPGIVKRVAPGVGADPKKKFKAGYTPERWELRKGRRNENRVPRSEVIKALMAEVLPVNPGRE